MNGRRTWRRPRRPLAALFALAVALAAPQVGAAAIFTVNTNDDGNGTCTALHCSLREAIKAANSSPGADQIVFNIPPGGPQTITPVGSGFPAVTGQVTIDATTQPGYTGSPIVEIDGSLAGSGAKGFWIFGSNSVVRGFVINRFDPTANTNAAGIFIQQAGGVIVENNYIGTNLTGNVALGNQAGILVIFSPGSNRIGGTTPAQRNVISGSSGPSSGEAVRFSAGSGGNVVQGNYMGTNATGTAPLGNLYGVVSSIGGNFIGGSTAGARNVISGNLRIGVLLGGGISGNPGAATDNVIQGNYIGVDATGNAPLGNGTGGIGSNDARTSVIGNVISANGGGGVFFGTANAHDDTVKGNLFGVGANGTTPLPNQSADVTVQTGSNNQIGGTGPGEANVMGYSRWGVVVEGGGTGNAILSNSIFRHTSLGIDLETDGPTPNDPGDADAGSNNRQNFPVLTQASTSGGTTSVQGTLNSQANTTYTLQFFANAACSPSGFGEGEELLGTRSVMTDASGNVSFSFSFSAGTAGTVITSTATDPGGSTSEFSRCIVAPVTPPGSVTTLSPATDTNEVDTDHTVTATATTPGGSPLAGTVVRFTVTGSVSTSGTCTTDSNGRCSFTYHGPQLPGADAISAFADVNGNQQQDASEVPGTASKTWILTGSVTTLSPATDTNEVDTDHTVTATVTTPGGVPVPGVTVRFTVSGSVSTNGTCTTNASGQCTFTYHGPQLPGADAITAYADVNGNQQQDASEVPGTASKTWILTGSLTTLSPPNAINPVDTNHIVTATVTTPGGVPVPGATVRFTVSGSVSTSGTCTTDTDGQCSFTYHGPLLPGADLITAYADVNGNQQQDASEVPGAATKEWTIPASTPGQVTGGGQAPALVVGEIAFGFNAQNESSGVKGNCNVVDKTGAHFKCVTVDSLVVTGTHAAFFGEATIDGATTNYRIDVDDPDEPGAGRDTFRVTTDSGYTAGGILTSGNIQIHQ